VEEALSRDLFPPPATLTSVIGDHPATELRTKIINRWETNAKFPAQIHKIELMERRKRATKWKITPLTVISLNQIGKPSVAIPRAELQAEARTKEREPRMDRTRNVNKWDKSAVWPVIPKR
jgi:hypothetical protein